MCETDMNNMDANRPLTVAEVADFLRYSQQAVRLFAERGQLPGCKVGREWRFDRRAIFEICRPRVQRREMQA